jgi:hypothetical protein
LIRTGDEKKTIRHEFYTEKIAFLNVYVVVCTFGSGFGVSIFAIAMYTMILITKDISEFQNFKNDMHSFSQNQKRVPNFIAGGPNSRKRKRKLKKQLDSG